MKLKFFLRGLGIGIIFTAVIFAVFPKTGHKELTDQEIMSKASELGMLTEEEVNDRLLDQSLEKLNSTASPGSTDADGEDDTDQPSAEPVTTGTPAPSRVPAASDEPEATSEVTPEPEPTKEPEASKEPKIEETAVPTVQVTITAGMSSERVSSLLEKLGIVSDGKALNKYLRKNGHEYRIRTGTFQIPSGASYKDIAGIITK